MRGDEYDLGDITGCPCCLSDNIKKKPPISTTDEVVVLCLDCGELSSISKGAYCIDEGDFEE